MNIYELVAQHCQSVGTSDTAQVQRFVGTLRSAGFQDDIPGREVPAARATLSDILGRHTLRTAKVAAQDQGRINSRQLGPANSVSLLDRFIEIEAYIEKGQCPRCHTSMDKVKLGSHAPGGKDFMQANFCKACRTTLWVK